MDCFVPRSDGTDVIASVAKQSPAVDCFVPRSDGTGVIARPKAVAIHHGMAAGLLAMFWLGKR